MTLNKINSKCPNCDCSECDVLCIIGTNDGLKVVVKCIEKNHQYTLDSKGKNTEWKKFFK